jgi:hypothetical protein
MPFKILNSFLVFLSRSFGFERTEITAFVRLRIFLSRIQTITALNFANHREVVSLGVGQAVSVFDVAQGAKGELYPFLFLTGEYWLRECEQDNYGNQSRKSHNHVSNWQAERLSYNSRL